METADTITKKDPHDQELGIHLFPTQADAAYWVIVVILFVVFTAGLVGASPVCMAPIAISMLILPARAILSWPEKELANQDLEAAQRLKETGVYQRLQEKIDSLGQGMEVRHAIRLAISRDPYEARAFGSWRRHFVLLGPELAEQIDSDLEHSEHYDKACALLAHEIAHLKHGDVLHIGYTRELLRACFVILPWWGLFLLGWLGFSFLSADALLALDAGDVAALNPGLSSTLSPALELLASQKAEIAEKMQAISPGLVMNFVVSALWPILFIGFVLWLFYWRRMIRLQEFYADNLAQEMIEDTGALLRAFGRYPAWVTSLESGRYTPVRTMAGRLVFSLDEQLFRLSSSVYDQWDSSRNRFLGWFDLHPTFQERLRSLQDPTHVQKDWFGVAGSVTVLVLSLNVLMSSPLVSYHSLGNPVYLSTIAIFIMLSTWIMPFIVKGQSFLAQLAKVLAVVFVLRAIFVAIDRLFVILLAIIAPTVALEFLNSLLLAIARYSRPIASLPVSNPLTLMIESVPVYLFLQLLLPLFVLVVLLGAYYVFVSRMSSILRVPAIANQDGFADWRRQHWTVVGTLSVIVVGLIMIPVAELAAGGSSHLTAPENILVYCLSLISLLYLLVFYRRCQRAAAAP